LTYGFLNFIQGTTTGCTPVTGVVRVQLGVCARVAGTATPSYAWNYVKSTATSAVWYQDTFSDALCATPAKSSTPMVTLTRTGCQKVKVNGALNHLTDGAYATVTLDYEYDAVPAASSLPASWVYTATWANNKACADPAHNYPTLLVASPLPPSATCPPTVSCGAASPSGPSSVYGTTFDSGCSTITPQDTGYMTLTQWTGPKVDTFGRAPTRFLFFNTLIMPSPSPPSSPCTSARGKSPTSATWCPSASAWKAPPSRIFPPKA
jgi:hypothetical protein